MRGDWDSGPFCEKALAENIVYILAGLSLSTKIAWIASADSSNNTNCMHCCCCAVIKHQNLMHCCCALIKQQHYRWALIKHHNCMHSCCAAMTNYHTPKFHALLLRYDLATKTNALSLHKDQTLKLVAAA